jgi:predicted nucleotide-binding protein
VRSKKEERTVEKHDTSKVASIKNLSKYEEVVRYLSEWLKVDFEIIVSPLPLGKTNAFAELAYDKERISMLYPSACNSNINFQDYSTFQLDELYSGYFEEQAMVGTRKTIIRRKYLDGFVNCMNDVFEEDWRKIRALVHRTKELPVFLTSKQFSLAVAPIILETEQAWQNKYIPPSSTHVSSEEITTTISEEIIAKVFVVHGKDELMKQVVARTIEQLGLKPIILHEQADKGRTVIEKFTECSDVDYAVILLSPDDYAYPKEAKPEKRKLRARQNVILELGYFIGKLGRKKIMALYRETDNFEMPTDFAGVVYTPFDDKWQFKLVKELKACGYDVDANKLI